MKDFSNNPMLRKCGDLLKRFRYPLIMLLIGLILLLLPLSGKKDTKGSEQIPEQEESVEKKLESILSGISGAGKVRVMLTVAEHETTVYEKDSQTDFRNSNGDITQSVTEKTVLYGSSSSESPIAVKVIAPKYQGALVLAEGGDIPTVRLNLVNAVASLTGLGTDKITVIKMNGK